MKEETKANVEEETESKMDKFWRITSRVLEAGAFVFFGALDIITGSSSNYSDKPTVDPDEELKREGYDKVGKDVWYDRDGKRREKDIWRKKKY